MCEEVRVHLEQGPALENEGRQHDLGQVHADPDLREQVGDHGAVALHVDFLSVVRVGLVQSVKVYVVLGRGQRTLHCGGGVTKTGLGLKIQISPVFRHLLLLPGLVRPLALEVVVVVVRTGVAEHGNIALLICEKTNDIEMMTFMRMPPRTQETFGDLAITCLL